jgi:hypothetical protein
VWAAMGRVNFSSPSDTHRTFCWKHRDAKIGFAGFRLFGFVSLCFCWFWFCAFVGFGFCAFVGFDFILVFLRHL